MKVHAVIQKIGFCYGHRLLDYDGKCAHPHGHNGTAELVFEAPVLDRRGMVIDFGEIERTLRSWIEEHLDHKMLLKRGDPMIAALKNLGEPCVELEENPTAENIARLIFERAREQGLPICEVKMWETDTQCAAYRGRKEPAA